MIKSINAYEVFTTVIAHSRQPVNVNYNVSYSLIGIENPFQKLHR